MDTPIKFARRHIAVAIILAMTVTVRVESQAVEGEWTAFSSMIDVNDVLVTATGMWAATQGGALFFDFESEQYSRYTLLNGLAGNRVLSLASDDNGHIWLGTEGFGLSRFRPETGTFDEPFREFEGLSIRALLVDGNNLYVGSNRGVSLFLIDREEVKETYRKLGTVLPKDVEVTKLAMADSVLWAGTAEGLAWADTRQANLQDPESWQESKRFVPVRDLLVYQGDVFIASKSGVFRYNWDYQGPGDPDRFFTDFDADDVVSLGMRDRRPAAAVAGGNFHSRFNVQFWTRIPGPIETDSVKALSQTSRDLANTDLWVATEGGVRVFNTLTPPPVSLEPGANRFYEMKLLENGDLWVTSTPNDQQESFGVYQLAADGWHIHNEASGLPLDDLVSLETDAEGRIWVGSWGRGVSVRSSTGAWLNMNTDNSILQGLPPDGKFAVVSDMARDAQGNMWLVNVRFGLVVVDRFPAPTRSHLVQQESLGFTGLDINKMLIGDDGLKWLTTPLDGFGVYDDGGTPYDSADDQAVFINRLIDPRLSSDRVTDLVVGLDGTVWIGTNAGLNSVRGRFSRLEGTFEVDSWRLYTTSDGLPSAEINDLEIDGNGNVWVATETGLSQIGLDGEIAFTLTRANSGLINDRITSLLFDSDQGELWIGTFEGLSRLAVTTGTTEQPRDRSGVFPNPFSASEGLEQLTFTGLPLGASLDIYNLGGELVAQVPGQPGVGTLTWDGLNTAGFVVGSGIYYFVANAAGGSQITGKFAILNGMAR